MSQVVSQGRSPTRRGRWSWGLALVVTLLVWAGAAHAETARAAGVRTAPRPSWVSALDLSGVEAGAPSGGLAVVALQLEARFVGGSSVRYFRRVVRVASAAGVRLAGEQRFGFVPPYQKLVLHAIELRRAAHTVSALNLDRLRILQRETELDAGVYSGERTAVALLDDVQVGDEVDCEYSIEGQNPVLGGHVMSSWQLRFSNALGLLRYRLLSDRPLTTVAFGGAPAIDIATSGALRQFSFNSSHVPEYPVEEAVPPEHDPFPWVQLSDFTSWPEVAAWGAKLFERPPPSASVVSVAHQIAERERTDEMRVVALLRFVQERVRYTSLALAEGSHRPSDPELVLKRGFGDCKDKSLLLIKLFEAIGVRAWPALVSSSGGERVATLFPTIDAFDHAIVALELNGRRYFVDATRPPQRGSLEEVADERFGEALLLGAAEGKLVTIPRPHRERIELHASLRYDVTSFDSPVKLLSKVTYRGGRAEALRAVLATVSQNAANKALQSVVSASHQDAEPIGTPFVQDDEGGNEIEVQQEYRLRSPWRTGAGGRHLLPLFPPWMRGELASPAAGRVSPMLVQFPFNVVHDIEVRLPSARPDHESSEQLSAGPYQLDYSEKIHGRTISIHYDFKSLRRRLEAAEFPIYREDVEKISKSLDLSIADLPKLTPAWSARASGILSVLWALVVLSLIILVQRYQPYLKRPEVARDPRLAKRAGWLWLLALGLTVAPIVYVKNVETMSTLASEPTWSRFTARESLLYRAWFAPVTTLLLLGSIAALLWGTYCAYLYWAKRRSFPLVCIIALLLASALQIGDHVVGVALAPSEAPASDVATFEVFFRCVLSAIWIGYLLLSRRVASVFVPLEENAAADDDDDDENDDEQAA